MTPSAWCRRIPIRLLDQRICDGAKLVNMPALLLIKLEIYDILIR